MIIKYNSIEEKEDPSSEKQVKIHVCAYMGAFYFNATYDCK